MEVVPFEACGARCIWGEDCTGHTAHIVIVPEPYQAGGDYGSHPELGAARMWDGALLDAFFGNGAK